MCVLFKNVEESASPEIGSKGQFQHRSLYTPDDAITELIMGLLREAIRYRTNKEGKKLWRVVSSLSVWLEQYMPDDLVKELIEFKLSLNEEIKKVSNKDINKVNKEMEIDNIMYEYGSEVLDACIRVFTNCPLIQERRPTLLEMPKSMNEAEEIINKIRKPEKITLFHEDIER